MGLTALMVPKYSKGDTLFCVGLLRRLNQRNYISVI